MTETNQRKDQKMENVKGNLVEKGSLWQAYLEHLEITRPFTLEEHLNPKESEWHLKAKKIT